MAGAALKRLMAEYKRKKFTFWWKTTSVLLFVSAVYEDSR